MDDDLQRIAGEDESVTRLRARLKKDSASHKEALTPKVSGTKYGIFRFDIVRRFQVYLCFGGKIVLFLDVVSSIELVLVSQLPCKFEK